MYQCSKLLGKLLQTVGWLTVDARLWEEVTRENVKDSDEMRGTLLLRWSIVNGNFSAKSTYGRL